LTELQDRAELIRAIGLSRVAGERERSYNLQKHNTSSSGKAGGVVKEGSDADSGGGSGPLNSVRPAQLHTCS
jgi:hypothetical protein